MIRYLTPDLLPSLKEFTASVSLCACKIACLLDSYGLNYDFACFWLQYNDRQQVTSAISRYGSDLTLQLSAQSDIEELREFLALTGYASVLSEVPVLTDASADTGVIMELTQPSSPCTLPEGLQWVTDPDPNQLYQLLKSCEAEDFSVPAYEDFLPDFSHKLRHGTAQCHAVRRESDQSLIACAMTVALSRHCAVIGGVATERSCRHLGLGSACVRTLCHGLDRPVLLMRDRYRHEHFYTRLGFRNTGYFRIAYR